MKIKTLSAAVAVALLSSSAFAVEYHGYARSGVGMGDDGAQTCEQDSKQKIGRLGNECETYAEMTLAQEVYNNDGKLFNVATTLAYTSDGSNDWEGTGDDNDATFAIREMYAKGTGVLGFAPEATVWAGKRFYQRNDIHITDFYYWDISGAGAGIEGIKVGDGALNFAWTRADRSDGFSTGNSGKILGADGKETGETVNLPGKTGAANVNVFDVRYTGLALGSANNLDFGITYGAAKLSDDQEKAGKEAKDGVMVTGQLTSNVLDGFNKLVLQFGTEGYAHALRYFGGGNWYGAENTGQDGTAYRIIDWGVIPAGDSIDVGYSFNYVSYDRDDFGDAHTAMNAVIRPSYKWNDYHKTILEAGYFTADDDAWGKETLSKVTLAQAISAGNGFWARPELRVFASYVATHEDDAKLKTGEDSEMTFGVQMEAWW